jgi:prepilin-type N-terminal cleavage/methylation domain-containing protein
MRTRKNGFTLVETLLALVMSSGLLAATYAFLAPNLNQFIASKDTNELRNRVASTLSMINNDAENSLAIYWDNTQCWLACMVDNAGNRTYYWMGTGANATTLYRKKEAVTNAISCTGGKTVAQNLDATNTSFSMRQGMLTTSIGAKGRYKNLYVANSLFFPASEERDIIFYEGFECDTLRDGWVVTPGTRSTWGLVNTTHQGHYQIGDSDPGTGTDSTSIQISLDLARMTRAHLSFYYYNNNINTAGNSPDAYVVSLWDGTQWNTVFSDAAHKAYASQQYAEVDLTPYNLNQSNILKFTSTLSQAGSNWYVDQIQIFTP